MDIHETRIQRFHRKLEKSGFPSLKNIVGRTFTLTYESIAGHTEVLGGKIESFNLNISRDQRKTKNPYTLIDLRIITNVFQSSSQPGNLGQSYFKKDIYFLEFLYCFSGIICARWSVRPRTGEEALENAKRIKADDSDKLNIIFIKEVTSKDIKFH